MLKIMNERRKKLSEFLLISSSSLLLLDEIWRKSIIEGRAKEEERERKRSSEQGKIELEEDIQKILKEN